MLHFFLHFFLLGVWVPVGIWRKYVHLWYGSGCCSHGHKENHHSPVTFTSTSLCDDAYHIL